MNIGEAAARSGLPTKTIRYYESIDLVAPARRANGFRDYGEGDVHVLRFIGCARGLGFTVEECRRLVGLFAAQDAPGDNPEAAARPHYETIDRKMVELSALRRTLDRLLSHADGGGGPIWPILEIPCEVAADK
jgi:MerR family transcriptional regulator, copper efflux regulator